VILPLARCPFSIRSRRWPHRSQIAFNCPGAAERVCRPSMQQRSPPNGCLLRNRSTVGCMTDQVTPTIEALKRYPQSSGFNVDLAFPISCVCEAACAYRCAGECGCEACAVRFMEFCDAVGRCEALVATSDAEAEALALYRSNSMPGGLAAFPHHWRTCRSHALESFFSKVEPYAT
jgi:hypothetical protein